MHTPEVACMISATFEVAVHILVAPHRRVSRTHTHAHTLPHTYMMNGEVTERLLDKFQKIAVLA